MDKYLIYIDTLDTFLSKKISINASNTKYITGAINSPSISCIPSEVDIKWNQVVFISNIQKIWSKGKFYIQNVNDLKIGIDYSKQYLTFKALESCTISFKASDSSLTKTILVSTDNGTTWINKTSSTSGTELVTLSKDDKLLIKGSNVSYGTSSYYNYFVSTGNFNVEGNIMSLVYSDNFVGQTTLDSNGYNFYNLFYKCNKLISVENLILPATTLAFYCYNGMFRGCTSLTTAPELPATTLTEGCYSHMFYGCTSLTEAPELLATTLTQYCYSNMFCNCESLNYVKCLATNISANSCTYVWLSGVFGTGVFIKANNMSNWTIGDSSGIPSRWMVDNYEDNENINYNNQYLTFKALENTTFTFTRNALQYSLDNGNTWTTLAANNASPTIISGSTIMWKQTGLTPNSSYGIGTFSATGKFKVYGNIMSLYYGDDFVGQTDLTAKDYAFYKLFYNNTKLVDASNLILPATTLTTHCYDHMFSDCTSLVKAPKLLATTLAKYCYCGMFYNCKSLVKAPELPATTLAEGCYYSMFYNCTSLVKAPELPATTLTISCYNSMFRGCTNLTTAPELPATTLAESCYGNMFANCTSLVKAPELPATTLAYFCYGHMFYYCTLLVEAPELPATTLAQYCYNGMFSSCTSLVKAPKLLSATILAPYCYSDMFSSCTSLVEAPELPATTLAEYCYSYMFANCSSLVEAPKLLTTTLARSCYSYMFNNCSSLVEAPELPATTLARSCYSYMFNNCSSLVEAPELPATTLAVECYNGMFATCTALKYIKCLATDISAVQCTYYWLYGVSGTGVFIKANNMSDWTTGDSGIPSGWTICNESEYELTHNYQLNDIRNIKEYNNNLYYRRLDNKYYPISNPDLSTQPSLLPNRFGVYDIYEVLMPVYGNKNIVNGDEISDCYVITYNDDTNKYLTFKTGEIIFDNSIILEAHLIGNNVYCGTTIFKENNIYNVYPLIPIDFYKDDIDFLYIKYLNGYNNGYYNYNNDTNNDTNYDEQYFTIVSLEDSNTISFKASGSSSTKTISVSTDNGETWTDKTSDTSGTTLATLNTGDKLLIKGSNAYYGASSYYNYFVSTGNFNVEGNIMSLVYSDNFVGQTTLDSNGYNFRYLFYKCNKLISVENLILPATTLAFYCYDDMFANCTALVKAPVLPATTLATGCYIDMFANCTALDYVKCLATDISASGCTSNWLFNVASSGTFVKDTSMNNWTTGSGGIPSNWTVQNVS